MPSDVGVESELLRQSLNPTLGEVEIEKWKQDPLALWLLTNSLPLRAAIEYGGLGGQLPTAPSLEERSQGLAGANMPLGRASVRQFVKGIDPNVPVDPSITSPKARLRDWIGKWLDKIDAIAPGTASVNRDKMLNAMAEMEASGVRGIKGLINAYEKKRIENFPATQYPHLRFSSDPNYQTSAAAHVQRYTTAPGEGKYLAGVEYKPPTATEMTEHPNYFWEALPEELAHQATSSDLRYLIPEQSSPLGASLAVSRVLGAKLGKGAPMTPVDKAVLEEYLVNMKNLPWKQEYKGVYSPETNPREYLEAFIRPAFEPRRFRSKFGPSRSTSENIYDTLTGGKSNYWWMWENKAAEFKKVHELLDLRIPPAAKKKNPSLFMSPEQQRFIDAFKQNVADEAALYRRHVLPGGLPKKPPAKQASEFGVGWITPRGEMKPLRSLTNDPFAEHSDVIEKLVQMEGTPNWKGFTRYRYDDEAAYVQFNAQSEEGLNNALEFVKSMHNGERNILVDVSGSPKWEMGEAGSLSFEPFERLPSVLAKIRIAAKKARGEPKPFTP